jgi:hypothetical protein
MKREVSQLRGRKLAAAAWAGGRPTPADIRAHHTGRHPGPPHRPTTGPTTAPAHVAHFLLTARSDQDWQACANLWSTMCGCEPC